MAKTSKARETAGAPDVTDQAVASSKLKASEAKYKNLFDSIDQGFCVIEVLFDKNSKPVDYRFLEVNKVFEKQTGLKHPVGKTASQLVPDLEKHWFEKYGKVALTGKPLRFIDGSEAMGRWFDLHASRVGGPESRKVAVLFTDITERKRAEERLLESEEDFRIMADAAPNMVWALNPDGTLRYINRFALEFLGTTHEKFVEQQWMPFIHPDDMEMILRAIAEAIQARKLFKAELRLRRKDGVYRWHLSQGAPSYSPSGKLHGYVGSVIDIHDRKQVEREHAEGEGRLRFMAESMPQKIFTATPDGKLDYFNPQWMSFTGATEAQIRKGELVQFIHPDDVPKHQERMELSLKSGEPFEVEQRFRQHDGTYRWHLMRAHAMHDERGNIAMWVGSNTDIDDIKRTTKQKEELEAVTAALREQREQLLLVNQAKDEFILLASHQLRTPATGVKQFVGMLLEGYAGELAPSQKQFLQRADESNERQLQIINDLLQVAQVDAGKIQLRKRKVDLTQLLHEVISEQAAKFRERGQKVVFRHRDAPYEALVDSDRIRMVFENLLDNGAKYSHPSATVEVRLRRTKRGLCVSFIDEGVGISRKDVGKLFHKFSRLDNPLSVSAGGTGLGLYWVKKIVDLHDGTVRITSEVGEGSTFTVTIPAGAGV